MTLTSHTRLGTTTRQVLVAALALIERPNGWCKGTADRDRADGTIAYCADQAIRVSARRPHLAQEALSLLQEELDLGSLFDSSIPTWNDKPERRKYQVVRAFKNAIASFGR